MSRLRDRLVGIGSASLLVIGVLGILWSAAIWGAGGLRIVIFNLRIDATDPRRPLIVAGVALGLRLLVDLAAGRGSWIVSHTARLARPVILGRVLAVATALIGLLFGSAVGGGADSSGYLSQAELWLRADLRIEQPLALEVPWPAGQQTLAPLGYRSSPQGDSIVPTYAPGFPILLAVVKAIGGQCALDLVVPLCTGLLIAATFAIGRQVGSAAVGAASAWLMATSPIVLHMTMVLMSDIPTAMFWTLAVYCCLRNTSASAALGGLAAAVAVLIRPNLALVALLIALWLIARDQSAISSRRRVMRALTFMTPVLIGAAVVAFVNRFLYGSPTSSGYGDLADIFSYRYVLLNIASFSRWIFETQTPVALLGIVALWIPFDKFRRRKMNTAGHSLLGVVSLGVIGSYLFYLNFEAWWYLRFLIPCWPAMCVSTAHLFAGPDGTFRPSAIALLIVVGFYGLGFAYLAGTLASARYEQRYVTVARLVRDATPPNSIIFSMQHSGSIRYYGGRVTLRYDALDAQWLDRAIDWLAAHGHRPYILLDEWEHEQFSGKFAQSNIYGKLEAAKVLEIRASTRTTLYDPLQTIETAKPYDIVIGGGDDWRHRHCVAPDLAKPYTATGQTAESRGPDRHEVARADDRREGTNRSLRKSDECW